MKTKEELNALKEEVETLNKKLAELTEDELEQVSGGRIPSPHTSDIPFRRWCSFCNDWVWWSVARDPSTEREFFCCNTCGTEVGRTEPMPYGSPSM